MQSRVDNRTLAGYPRVHLKNLRDGRSLASVPVADRDLDLICALVIAGRPTEGIQRSVVPNYTIAAACLPGAKTIPESSRRVVAGRGIPRDDHADRCRRWSGRGECNDDCGIERCGDADGPQRKPKNAKPGRLKKFRQKP